jgi:hypothetical protein
MATLAQSFLIAFGVVIFLFVGALAAFTFLGWLNKKMKKLFRS